jgi:peptidoglycan/LPS O-acetylase OafA/YrhL
MYIFHITTFWIIYQIYKAELASFSESIGLGEWKNDVGFFMAFAATVTIASLSYRYFERPFLRLKKRFTVIPSRD